MHQSLELTHFIPQEQQGLYLRVPVEVPQDVDRLVITYAYQRHLKDSLGEGISRQTEINTIDLALENPGGELTGASGSNRTEIYLHENHATPGYLPQKVQPGTWQVVLGAYRIATEGVEVQIKVQFHKKQTVLLRGDCHSHTVHSDGWYTVEEATQRARQDKLDFLFITDHNSMTSNEQLVSDETLTVLPGVEITYFGGHYNLFGVKRPVKTYVANTREQVLAILHEGRSAGAISAVNHPVDPGCPWTFGLGEDVPMDAVEVWNGPFTPANQAAIDLWHSQLCQGRIWPAIGGSDCHHTELFRTHGTPTTFLYARSRSASDILSAIREGSAFIGMHPEAPHIFLQLGQARMGQVHQGQEDQVSISVSNLSAGDEVQVITVKGIIYRHQPGACLQYQHHLPVAGSLFVRVEIRRSLPIGITTLAALSNPIYIRGEEMPL